MTEIEILELDEGYIIRHGEKAYARESHVSMLNKIIDVFNIPNIKISEQKVTEDQTPEVELPTINEKKKDSIPHLIEKPHELEDSSIDQITNSASQSDMSNPCHELEVPIFHELTRINHSDLKDYISIESSGMGYHDQKDGNIVICNGTTKVYTSWLDMFKLPIYIDGGSIENINNLKQVAVRTFRKWMNDNPSLLPDGIDPDADFRQMLKQDTGTGYDGSKIEGDLSQE